MLPALFTPDYFKQLEVLQFKTKRAFLGSRQGGHISPRKGHGIEFSDYRKYELGDNPRHIDWGVYGRTDRLYVKRFLEEEDLSVLVLLDASTSMFQPSVAAKWHRARDVALSLSYVALSEHDTVQCCALGHYYSPKMTSLRALHVLAQDLNSLETKERSHEDRAMTHAMIQAVARIRFPGVAILISDCFVEFHEFEAALNVLRAKNLLITVVQILGPEDLKPLTPGESGRLTDSESGEEIEVAWSEQDAKEYAKGLEMHMSTIKHFCRSAGIQFAQLMPDQDLKDFIVKELPTIGILS